MKTKPFYCQSDGPWSQRLWYDKKFDSAICKLTRALHAFARDTSLGGKLAEAGAEVAKVARDAGKSARYPQNTRMNASINQTGCWHVTIANMLSQMNQIHDGNDIDPGVLLDMLQEQNLGTLTGYVGRPFVDPLSILTDGRVQLSGFRDFGANGVHKNDQEIVEMLSRADGRECCAVVNVNRHEYFDDGDSHYVLVAGRFGADFRMLDPDETTEKGFFEAYGRAFQVTLYRRMA